MSGEINLQHIHLNEVRDRPTNPYVSCMDRQSRGTEAGSDYLNLEEEQTDNLYISIVSRQSRGLEVGSDYDFGIGGSSGKENDAYDTIGDINNGKKENFVTTTAESRDASESTARIGFFTKKRLVLGAVVLFIIVAVVSIVTPLTLGGDGDEQLKSNQKTMLCPNVPSTGMNYPAAGKTGIQGRRFLICFTDNHPKATNQSKTIFILSEEDFEFKLVSEFLDSSQLFNEVETQSRNLKEINVTNTIALSYFKVEQKALLIETTKDASVIIIDNYIHSSDSTVILPINSISKSYIISTAYSEFNNTFPNSQFAIASPKNGTVIKIYFHFDPDLPLKVDGITYRNGSTMILVLNELETYQIWHKVDASGTFIHATSPVAVFSGSQCDKIAFEHNSDFGYCSKHDEQIPPIDRLDKMYIVPPNYNRKGTILKIVSPFKNRLTYKIGNKQTVKTLQPNGYFEVNFSDEEVVVIDSEKPVLVTSFSTGSYFTGDPYMITVPGIRQYTDKYLVTVPGNFEKSYIGLMIEEKSLYNMVLNDTEIIQYLNDRKFYATVTIKDIKFVVLVLQVSGGMLKIKSTNNAAFGLIVYGHRKNDGHGFAGKAVLSDTCADSYE
ncbi:IgGFc-binding protein-like [Saccostrea echinata]|uniref:IgGFc-binding protein-like n=1 Tax=Saccostrea echinata TaxID=191078 RepID=UPI002A82DF4A|nr:IgGFc-binding protein-like [Saccostrea echinata]